jgi:poly-gamma-glutamate capsule biosynthesis protein CapA/YwtB (metallophosphatase superfamily)
MMIINSTSRQPAPGSVHPARPAAALCTALLAAVAVCGCRIEEPAATASETSYVLPSQEAKETENAPPAPGTPGRFSVFAAGDIYLGWHLADLIKKHGPAYPFSRLADEVRRHDVAFANLESAISTGGSPPWNKNFLFRVTPSQAAALKESGLDVLSVANNHSMDFGREAFIDTLRALEEMKIAHVGGGRSASDAAQPATFEKAGTRIVFLAYSAWSSSLTEAAKDKAGIVPLQIEKVVADVKKYKEQDAVVLVSVHWGLQHTEKPGADHVRMARAMIDAGADAVLGHHPHCPQSVEIYKGKPVFYSLGNFVFGRWNRDMKHNIAAVLRFEGKTLEAVEILPIHGLGNVNAYRPWFLSGKEALTALDHVEKISKSFGTKITALEDRGVIEIPHL